jgi:ribonuclease HII
MCRLETRYPGYGLARHKGYATGEHLQAVRRLGPSAMHRRTFRGVRPESAVPGRGQGCLPGL